MAKKNYFNNIMEKTKYIEDISNDVETILSKSDEIKAEYKQVVSKEEQGVLKADEVIDLYNLISENSAISASEKTKLLIFLDNSFFDIFLSEEQITRLNDLENRAKIFFRLSDNLKVLAYHTLKIIRDNKLYPNDQTFEDYVNQTFGVTRRTAYYYLSLFDYFSVKALSQYTNHFSKLFLIVELLNQIKDDQKKEEAREYLIPLVKEKSYREVIGEVAKYKDNKIRQIEEVQANTVSIDNGWATTYEDIICKLALPQSQKGWDYVNKIKVYIDNLIVKNKLN